MAKLFVICGHGAGDPGACGNGYQEYERVRVLGKKIKELGGANVMLGDVNRDYYQDAGINSLTISKDYQILELHMDSAAASARGGHVIINGNYTADSYDTALANMIASMFPGRSNKIVGRTDLANVNRAAAKGYSYRLMECGFITNATDVQIFNSNIDNLARKILACFGITAAAAAKAGWVQDSKGWWYRNSDGTYPKNDWKQINGKWYFFDTSGYMKTGWVQWRNNWYYCDKSGAMLAKRMLEKPDGDTRSYYLHEDGRMARSEVLSIDNKFYAFLHDGRMATKIDNGSLS